MANFVIADPIVGAPLPATLTATFATSAGVFPPLAFGAEVQAFDRQTGSTNAGAGRFVLCQGSNVASAGQFVMISNNSAVLLAAANSVSKFPIGVAAGVLSATNVYGWVQVQGLADYCVGTNVGITAGVAYYVNAGTAGFVQTAPAAGNMILGLVAPVSAASAVASRSGTFHLNRPQVVGLTAGL